MKIDLSSFKADKSVIKRIGLCLQYDGRNFCGWQKQKTGVSVQDCLEKAIAELDPYRPIKTIAAGRTDAGVHAAGQVVHFDCSGYIPSGKWANALNGRLPNTIRIRQSILRPIDWHACYSAIYRRYRYTIYNGCAPNLFLAPWTLHCYRFRLDEKLMRLALKGMLGFHDFAAFQRAGSKRSNSFTTIQDVKLERNGDLIHIEIQASGFLYGMVRLLVGQLVAVGEHQLSVEGFKKKWIECRRSEIRHAAPAQGLCLIRAGYKELIFSESAWYESCPKYSLMAIDPPSDPP